VQLRLAGRTASHAGGCVSSLVARAKLNVRVSFEFETGTRYSGHTREKSERRLRQYTGLQYVDPTG
jgi:hypothetical protein